MKSQLADLLLKALNRLARDGVLAPDAIRSPSVERARDPAHGDFATNAAMVHAKPAGLKPRDLAQRLVDVLPADERIAEVTIAGPGFINFRLAEAAYHDAGS
jgi:arginyl-tRNA synthetase